ncbi:MAG: redoxin domain-containing protein [Deltaproteobacteria bacterium]|nr:redoxin domain-containing protein [Deltaproteobacteria bacterium]
MSISQGVFAADPFEAFSVLRIEKKLAPDFSLPQVGGKTVRLSDYKGKIVLLGFFKTF